MNRIAEGVGKTLQSAYDEQYSDSMTEWRELGGKYKAQNLLGVCNGRSFGRVLDCGAGEGSILKYIDESGLCDESFAIDISDSGIAQIGKRKLKKLKEVRKFDGYEIPYPDKHFSLAYCFHVIEHVEHPRLLLRELQRVSEYQAFEIPLDYSVAVDRNVQRFLSYGHINVYTPSLFRFILLSEGYEILSDRLTHTAEEMIRFNWYRNMGLPKSLGNEMKVGMVPFWRALKRILIGRRRYDEYGYSAYTCLTKQAGELKIF